MDFSTLTFVEAPRVAADASRAKAPDSAILEIAEPVPQTSLDDRLRGMLAREADKEHRYSQAMETLLQRIGADADPYLRLLSVTAKHTIAVQKASAVTKKFTTVFDTLVK